MGFRPSLCAIRISTEGTLTHLYLRLQETHIMDEESSRLTLFDTGPDSRSLVRNAEAMQIPVEQIERVVTSHWHSDHTGGLLAFLNLRRSKAVESDAPKNLVVVDLHPDRPVARGIAPGPTYDKILCALPFDPTFQAIETAGGVVEKHAEGHAVAGGAIWVSGEIPRVTDFEFGILGGMRWTQKRAEESPKSDGEWVSDQVFRFLPYLLYRTETHLSRSWMRDTLLSTSQGKVWWFLARQSMA